MKKRMTRKRLKWRELFPFEWIITTKPLAILNGSREQKGYFDNPGEFYQALTLMKRNLPGDKQKAKILLQEVVNKNLTDNETAQDWLKDL